MAAAAAVAAAFGLGAAAWAPPELSEDEFANQEVLQKSLFDEYYHSERGFAVGEALRQLGHQAFSHPSWAFGVANGLYHFFFYREDWHPAAPHSMLSIEDMSLAAELFKASLQHSSCLDPGLDLQSFLMGLCQQKLAMLFLLQLELGAAMSCEHRLAESAAVLRAAADIFEKMQKVQYHALLGDIGWKSPADLALNDELYPRSFGAVWPAERFPYAQFLEANFETFLGELQAILAEEGLFEQLRRLARNAEGLAVWPPDARGHVQLLDGREENPMLATCAFAPRSCELLAARPELRCGRGAAFLARLEPNAWLKPHLGNSRRLAAHLGLITAEGTELNVGPARRLRWQVGRAFVWDDTHVHDARHNGEGTRYILQSFFCHPCEQRELYQSHELPAVRSLASDAACEFAHPVRAEVARALRQEMDAREEAYRSMPRMTVRADAPVSV
ncbi:unnamed protein product [Effrenium voratum]|uniref:Aspartyl/asparaginy/proline hydroxylase domain-containing protein n=1 Tax=Effrenium voratum TaxID=2562239 RepID=A0AA36N5H4_9DINO|nr:unnamed protein product [Effrenium voratum]